MRILIADDNADNRETLGMLLEIDGHEVFMAKDGEEALELADQLQPEAIFLDIGMPKQNGFAVCKIIRTLPWAGHCLIVAVTGWATEQDRRTSREAGFDYHFAKPIEPETVRALLAEEASGRKRAARG